MSSTRSPSIVGVPADARAGVCTISPWSIAVGVVFRFTDLLGWDVPSVSVDLFCSLPSRAFLWCWRCDHCCAGPWENCIPPSFLLLGSWQPFLNLLILSRFLHDNALDHFVLQFRAYWLFHWSHNPSASVTLSGFHGAHFPTSKEICHSVGSPRER